MKPRRLNLATLLALVFLVLAATPSQADHPHVSDPTSMMTAVDPNATFEPIIKVGEAYHDVLFEGIPDGIGLMPSEKPGGVVEAFVNHEQSEVPFQGQADFQDSSVTRLTLNASADVIGASVAIPESAGFMRFCSATMAGPDEGLKDYVFFTNEETDDNADPAADPDATYGPDPSIAPFREGGYAVVLDPDTALGSAPGTFEEVAGMGRHNHENSMVVPGNWNQTAVLSGDDTFNPTESQLYLYLADHEPDLWNDKGSLWAFRVTRTDEGPVDPEDPFNGANDYGDITVGDEWQGRFIRVPKEIARGTLPDQEPQAALEQWSDENNVFQFIRVEDTAYDVNSPRVVYMADTGATRVIPNEDTGRLFRPNPVPPGSGFPPQGLYPNGRIFRMKFDAENPHIVNSFSILLNADPPTGGPSPALTMFQPDNLGTSEDSLMVQEDSAPPNPNSRIWRYDLDAETWSVVGRVNDSAWESSGIVDASDYFGAGTWLLDVQAHNVNVSPGTPGLKREGGQLLLLRLPGS
jgi:hypothetical protein